MSEQWRLENHVIRGPLLGDSLYDHWFICDGDQRIARVANEAVGIQIVSDHNAALRLAAAESESARLVAMIVESASTCTIKGCEHCKWLGFNMGRHAALASVPSEPAKGTVTDDA